MPNKSAKRVGRHIVKPEPTKTTETGLPKVASDWDDDREDRWSERIAKAHPTNTGLHTHYAIAMEMVGNRHSKGALVELVNWLLTEMPDDRI